MCKVGRAQLGRSRYPQVDPRARELAHAPVAACPAQATVAQALRRLQREQARLLVIKADGKIGAVRPGDLRRAQAFGLTDLAVGELAWWSVPTVSEETSEVRVRRLLLAGAPLVLVKDRGAVVGAVEPVRSAPGACAGGVRALSVARRLERQLPGETIDLLRAVGRLADSLGVRAYVAGGLVRDLLRAAPTQDVDLVVEGNGLALARRLCSQLGGNLLMHLAFGTASIEGWIGGRVDIAIARRERYTRPGALPTVTPARIDEDLARRDFSVNAMAIALTGPAFGQLLDPFGGERDLMTRRIRILHPLSFVEDPTRIFRAARYACRLGFRIDRWTRRGVATALHLAPYAALSGQRLLAEIELIVSEPGWRRSLPALGRLGAFRLLDRSYRFSREAARRLSDLGDLLRLGRDAGVALDPLPLVLLGLVGHLPFQLAERCLRRLALSGEPLARLTAALAEGPSVARRLEEQAAAPASQRAAILRSRTIETLGFAWLVGSESARHQIRWFVEEGRRVGPLLGGEDLLALGVSKGPAVARLLHWLRDRRLDGQVSSRDEEARLVREWIEGRGATPFETLQED